MSKPEQSIQPGTRIVLDTGERGQIHEFFKVVEIQSTPQGHTALCGKIVACFTHAKDAIDFAEKKKGG